MISSSEALDVVRRAKSRDLEIACSVSINHLALNEVDIGDYRSFAKLDPPLRDESDRLSLLEGINDGTIDVIVSNHDPRPAGEKRLPYAEASTGAVGLELLLAAGLSQVADGRLDAEDAPADLIIFNPNAPWVCDSDILLSRSKNTPLDGRRMTGRNLKTIVGGRVVFDSSL